MSDGPTSGILWLPPESYNAAVDRFSDTERAQIKEDELRHFPQPDDQETLWRYLETYKFKDLLESKTLYLCQVSKLEKIDPNEGLMNRLQLESLRRYLREDEAQLQNFVSFHEHTRQRAWVTCFSLGQFEEVYMWERFSKSGLNEGVAIKTNYQKLKHAVAESPEANETYMAKVRYEETEYMPWKIGYLLYQKLPRFSDEREMRICVCNRELELDAQECSKEFYRLPVNVTRLVQQIYIHPNASESYFREIQKLVTKHLPKRQNRIRWSKLRSAIQQA